RLADSLPQFDVIVGGHSHILLESPKFENGVMIVQAGANLKYIGKTTLTIEDGKVTGRSDEVIPLSTLAREDREIRQLIDACNDNPAFKEVVGKATMPLAGVEELGSLMTDAVTHQMKVDFAFQNKGGIRISAIPAGDITLRDVYKLDPFGNHLVIYSMTPDEIRSLICYGYTHEKGIDLQVSGMTYRIIGDGTGSCSRVEMFDPSGKPLDPKQEYSVAINDYMANTYRFDHKDPGTVSTLTTSEVLIRYLRTVGSVNYSGVTRAAAAN
ncbi:MAG TPA: 5'-nucleotidase C-terminal domain-containing protein, partial [Bacteroidales bacterium]|nr:5'-nucleotidase C-terminal domain-containing protein [Bacteroidales bacterium]